jgi:DNA-binding protein HU-beta
MTKPEFIAEVAKVAETTKIDAEKVINAMLETVQETLAKGDSIQFVGFGTFEVKERAAREGINPRTKEKIQIAAKKAPAFKAGKKFKDAVAS